MYPMLGSMKLGVFLSCLLMVVLFAKPNKLFGGDDLRRVRWSFYTQFLSAFANCA